jgi:hypothetical protein
MRNEFKIYKNFDFSFTLNAKLGSIYQNNEIKNQDRFYDRANFYEGLTGHRITRSTIMRRLTQMQVSGQLIQALLSYVSAM